METDFPLNLLVFILAFEICLDVWQHVALQYIFVHRIQRLVFDIIAANMQLQLKVKWVALENSSFIYAWFVSTKPETTWQNICKIQNKVGLML